LSYQKTTKDSNTSLYLLGEFAMIPKCAKCVLDKNVKTKISWQKQRISCSSEKIKELKNISNICPLKPFHDMLILENNYCISEAYHHQFP